MTEREKKQMEMPYLPQDKALIAERMRAKDACFAYNQTLPSDKDTRSKMIKELLGKTGKRFCIESPFHCDYGYNIEIGEDFFSNYNLIILDCGKVTFGDHVFIGPDCGFHTPTHPIDAESRNAGWEQDKPITVGSDVWFGAGVQVLPGVSIGSNVVIGGGSVVTKDIPDNCVAVGNPCRVLRPITEADKFQPETAFETSVKPVKHFEASVKSVKHSEAVMKHKEVSHHEK